MMPAGGFSAVFIRRPVGTVLLTLGLALAGLAAFFQLPVAPLPQVDFPTIVVSAQMAGASPETMATSVATPLERYLGVIADVTEMTSSSTVGSTRTARATPPPIVTCPTPGTCDSAGTSTIDAAS